jgi:hypothetical protein
LFGRPNSSTVFKFSGKIKSKKTFFRKSQDGSTGVINVHLTKQLPAGKQNIDAPAGNYLCTIFVSPPLPKQAKKIIKRPRQLLYLHSAVCQDLNALPNHINFFVYIIFFYVLICYNTPFFKAFCIGNMMRFLFKNVNIFQKTEEKNCILGQKL